MFVKIVFVSTTGIFEYRFVMSNETKVKCGSNGVPLRFWMRSLVFFYVEGIRQWCYVVDFVCTKIWIVCRPECCASSQWGGSVGPVCVFLSIL